MRQSSFNVVHLAVALLCVVVFVTLAIAVGSTHRDHRARPMQNNTQLRGIHQSMVTFSNSNRNYFPGLHPDGTTLNLRVEYRYQILLEEDFFTPEYAISPSETEDITEWEGWDAPDGHRPLVTQNNYSYAMLQVPEEQSNRRSEWSQTLNTQAIVLSDRNTGSRANPTSVHTDRGGPWGGGVLRNDNSVSFESTDIFETKYGASELNEADRLFEAVGPSDALLIHSGNKE